MTRLTFERRLRGWSQAELGRRSGVNATTISLVESRRFVPGAVQLAKLGTALAVRLRSGESLLDEVESKAAAAGAAR